MHGTSHYLGLNVHDWGTNKFSKRVNVITVEPGISFGRFDAIQMVNIGGSIEDDILITDGEPITYRSSSKNN